MMIVYRKIRNLPNIKLFLTRGLYSCFFIGVPAALFDPTVIFYSWIA